MERKSGLLTPLNMKRVTREYPLSVLICAYLIGSQSFSIVRITVKIGTSTVISLTAMVASPLEAR